MHNILKAIFSKWILTCFGIFAPGLSDAEDLTLQSVSVRARISEQTLLGADAPERFEAYDVSANYPLPWQSHSLSAWGLETRLMASAGVLRGAGNHAFVVSLIPELILWNEDRRFAFDLGVGGALFSRHRFGEQDYGGPFQFALTLGISVPFYKALGLGYRFQHYSDAAVNGSDTTGADFHMIELIYRL